MIRLAKTYNLEPFFIGLIIIVLVPGGVTAQIISPGKLSEAHSFLEGISRCTQCHQLGEPNIINQKCLDCHTPIQTSILQMTGFHGREEIIVENCSSCHKEHFGTTFDVLHFDSTAFDHSITGFELDGEHNNIECGSCHNETSFIVDSTIVAYFNSFDLIAGREPTFLGLNSQCLTCHMDDNVHGNQFLAESCASCHTTDQWEEAANFDHAEARFQLTGKHVEVTCGSCHESMSFEGDAITRYVNIPFESCESCHEDVHEGRMTQLNGSNSSCESCHTTEDWHRVSGAFSESGFSHEQTGYALVGAHFELSCLDCHRNRNDEWIETSLIAGTENNTYPVPQSENCVDCHVDYHEGAFVHTETDNDCESCHTVDSWYPSTFGLEAHNSRSRFPLTGAHIATACFSCHLPSAADQTGLEEEIKPVFEFADISCLSCHDEENPHGNLAELWSGSQTEECESCHSVQSWASDISFDHEAATGYALIGQHAEASCKSCHFESATDVTSIAKMPFNNISAECESCHETDSPHQGQFANSVMGASCENCHDTESFRMSDFDHSLTSFPLEGGHIGVACVDCHTQEIAPDGSPFIRFFPLSSECSSCHED